MIRVLHCLDGLTRGRIETMLMNIYRNLDRGKVQFDFLLTNPEHCDYEDEVVALGGYFRIPRISLTAPWQYMNGLDRFFKEYQGEWKIVHEEG